ncbi:hypothetical protein D3C77_489270 [compost metagenome]
MQQVTDTEFAEILQSAERENAERLSVGLDRFEVTTHAYGALGGSGELVEYYFAGSMFGFVQGGVHYSNGL